jgi:hypothetical protein
MKKETHKINDKTESYAQQLPSSVAYYVNNNDEKTTRLLYDGVTSNETLLICGSVCYLLMPDKYSRDKLLTVIV